MGTEVAISFTTLRTQLENEKNNLCKIDENIKKIVQTPGRFVNDRFNNSVNDYGRNTARLTGRNSYSDSTNNYNKKVDDNFGKRRHETKTVFSRLSARNQDSDNEGEDGVGGPDDVGGGGGPGFGPTPLKRSRMLSAVCRELPSRAEVLRAQGGDEASRDRNRRMFGSLLGTLHKFKQEEIVLQTKEEKKAQVERKIEEQARLQKEKEQRERKSLFAEREQKKATIKTLEAKMLRVSEFEKWEEAQKCLGNFILTKSKPHIYWIPKVMNDKAEEKLSSSRKYHEKIMTKKREELQEELQRIEQRSWRRPGTAPDSANPAPTTDGEAGGRSKRDKFAAEADVDMDQEQDKEDSDVEQDKEDNHVEQEQVSESVKNCSPPKSSSSPPPPPTPEPNSVQTEQSQMEVDGTEVNESRTEKDCDEVTNEDKEESGTNSDK